MPDRLVEYSSIDHLEIQMTAYMDGDVQATNEVLRKERDPRNEKGQSWLRHSGKSGNVDIALINGADASTLELLRPTWRRHRDHLEETHKLTVEFDKRTELFRLKRDREYDNILHDIDEIQRSKRVETEKKQLISARLGQGKFRRNLFSIWKACAVTGLAIPDLLRASHIKPWSDSNDFERLDPCNGFLLSSSYDAVFDNGFITFDEDGFIVVSDSLNDDELSCLGIRRDASIALKGDNRKYLEYHRKERFRK